MPAPEDSPSSQSQDDAIVSAAEGATTSAGLATGRGLTYEWEYLAAEILDRLAVVEESGGGGGVSGGSVIAGDGLTLDDMTLAVAAGDGITVTDTVAVDTTVIATRSYVDTGISAAALSAGAGLTLTGSTLAVGAGTGVTVAADTVGVDTTVIATRTYVDSAGLGRYRGSWTAGVPADGLGAYTTRDIVVYQGSTYRANSVPSPTTDPPSNNLDWDILALAGADGVNGTNGVSFTFQGSWVSGTPYLIGQWVEYLGALYYCNGAVVSTTVAPPLDPGWDLGMEAGAAGLTIGQAPQNTVRTNGYLFTVGAGSGGNATTVSVNATCVSPIVIAKATTIDRICLYINTATATALWRLGIYADTGTIYPGAKLLDAGTVDASTTGAKEIVIGSPLAVTAGIYWVAAKPETVFTAARGTSGPVFGVSPVSNSNTGDVAAGYLCSGATTGSLLDNFTAYNGSGMGMCTTVPRVGVRVTG